MQASNRKLEADKMRDEGEVLPVTAHNISLERISDGDQRRVRGKLCKHEAMWDGHLGEINTTKHRIYLKTGCKPFAAPTYRSGPGTRALEQAESNAR